MKPVYLTRIWSWIAVAGVVLALGACGQSADPAAGSQDAPTTTPRGPAAATLTDDQEIDAISQEIDRAELLWEGQAISHYRLVTTFSSFGSDITVTVVVSGSQVIEHECAPDPNDSNDGCKWARKTPQKYTVAGLFSELRHLLSQVKQTGYPPNQAMDVLYDDQLGYPRRIVWNPPEYTRWNVMSFEQLP
jgi:hypothetical protein